MSPVVLPEGPMRGFARVADRPWRAAGVYFLAFSLSRPEPPLTARLASLSSID
jgi:hypothetical protein